MPSDPEFLTGLPAIIDSGVEVLVLGSFPSPSSLAAQQYYAHRQNQFWRIIAAITSKPLPDLDYASRVICLLRHGIGVWDVYRHCRRAGALDSAIKTAVPNDFTTLKTDVPRLRRICFNGQESSKFERTFREQGYATYILPSTSPAYTLSFELKLERWREALQPHSE
ncbi:MAG: DNA-deoxyinosine glycosylase [Betaproteobacteria bacterium]